MITGIHTIVYTKNADADRAFFRDILKMKSVDVGDGWLIFAAPPAEIAFHPGEENDLHELYLMCDDVQSTLTELRANGIQCSEIADQGWGRLTTIKLPGGGDLGIYQPRHALAHG